MSGAESLLPVALAFLVVTVSPGPANIAAATTAMRFGRRRSLLFGAGLGCGLAFWGGVAATGLGAVLQGSVYLLMALKMLGGAYLIWLALQAGRAALRGGAPESRAPGAGRWFVRGLALNLSNPKAVIAWLAALSMGLQTGGGSRQVIIATAVCIALGFANYAAHAIAFSVPGVMSGYRRFGRWIEGVVAGLFAIAGLGLIRSALAR